MKSDKCLKECRTRVISHERNAKQNHVRHHRSSPGRLKLKGQMITDIGKNVEQLELTGIIGGSVKWHNHSGKNPWQFRVISHTSPMNQKFHSSYDSGTRRNENVCPQKDLYTNVLGIFIITGGWINTSRWILKWNTIVEQ